ncbi:hypothetical protein BS78_01G222400 [Paspalum vaginatum]|nr:hypothetical protein BS78_01G222400 [Paspalum vaginatum]
MEQDAMEVQLLITGPADEANLYECLGGTGTYARRCLPYFTAGSLFAVLLVSSTGFELMQLPLSVSGATLFVHSLIGDIQPSVVEKAVTHHEVDDYVDQSMLGCFFAPRRCRQRGTRMRSSWRVEVPSELLGRQYTCTSRDGKCTSRKNNDHWTEDEMENLLDGVSKKGIGKWSKVKESYFSLSIRTAVHLKDKWRNLVRACKA